MKTLFESPFKTRFPLKRYPSRKKENLQAWDSADELILQHLSQLDLNGKRILILNDQFGALSCSLEKFDMTTYTDSYISFRGIQLNSQNRILPLSQLDEIQGQYDLVILRIPKNMSFFEDLLCHLSHHLHADSRIICGYMIKHQANVSFDLLNRYIGETHTSLAHKKARLIFSNFQRIPVQSPYPIQLSIDSFSIPFINHSNLFSREKLDIGTRFLLQQIPKGNYSSILDLGCANGVIGIAAKLQNPSAKLLMSDESKMAIQSATANYQRYFPDQAEFYWTNCFENQKSNFVDLAICNPPFHQGNLVTDSIAYQMFSDAFHVLVKGGLFRVIGNSHLPYPQLLKRIFGNSKIIATHQKFIVIDAIKS